MRPWLGTVAAFLLGLTVTVTFYEGRRIVRSAARALTASSTLDEGRAEKRVERRDERDDRGEGAARAGGHERRAGARDLARQRPPRGKAKGGRGGQVRRVRPDRPEGAPARAPDGAGPPGGGPAPGEAPAGAPDGAGDTGTAAP